MTREGQRFHAHRETAKLRWEEPLLNRPPERGPHSRKLETAPVPLSGETGYGNESPSLERKLAQTSARLVSVDGYVAIPRRWK